MATITLKDVPDRLHRRLRERAAYHGRSLKKEIIALLEQAVLPQKIKPIEFLSRVARVHEQLDFRLTINEIQEAIENGRP